MAAALLVAAGAGERLGYNRPKALVPLAGRPMLEWSLDTLRSLAEIEEIVVALPAGALSHAPGGVRAVAGGAVRSASVRAALSAASDEHDVVIVHDAARPLAAAEVFQRALAELRESGADAVVAAVRATDTIKEVENGEVVRTLSRQRLWAVQTPQVFRRSALVAALAQASEGDLAAATDDAWLIERRGGRVRVAEGDPRNMKITTPTDLRLAELLLAGGKRAPMIVQTGIGYDCHRLIDGRRLVLGGVELSAERGLLGHSDADVLTHAIIDAMLGAAALGDIGQHFPDTEERYRDVDSQELLGAAVELVLAAGFHVQHVDATVVIERPKLAPFREEIRARLAGTIGIDVRHLNLKATRGEGMGFVGREEGAAALAVVTLRKA